MPFLPAWTQGGLVPVLALVGFVLAGTALWQNWRRRQLALQGKRIAKAEAAAEEAQRLADEESAAAAAAAYEANRIHRSRLAQQRAEWEAAAARSLSGRAASVMARAWLVPALLSLKAPPPPPEPTLQTRRRSLSGIFGAALARTFSRSSENKEEAIGGRRRRSIKALVRSGSQIMRSWSRCSESSPGSECKEGGRPRRRSLKALVRSWSRASGASESSADEAGGARHRPLKALMRSFSRCSESSAEEAGGAHPTPLKALMRSCSRSWSRESGGGGGDGGKGGGCSCGRTFSGALERARSVSFHPSVSPAPPPAAISGEQNQSGSRKHRKRRSKASKASPSSAASSKWAGPPVTAPAAEGTWSSAGWALEAPKRPPPQQRTPEKEARGLSDGAGGSQSGGSSPASSRADTPFDAARRELHGMLEGVEASIEGFVTEAKTEDWLIETCSTLGRSPSVGAVGAGVGLRLACTAGAADIAAPGSPERRKRHRRTRAGGSGHSSPTKSGHSSPTKKEVRV